MSETIRVMVVDDHPIVREGLRLMLAPSDDLLFVGDAADGEAALQLIAEVQPDVVLLDMRMPGMDGLSDSIHSRSPMRAGYWQWLRPKLRRLPWLLDEHTPWDGRRPSLALCRRTQRAWSFCAPISAASGCWTCWWAIRLGF